MNPTRTTAAAAGAIIIAFALSSSSLAKNHHGQGQDGGHVAEDDGAEGQIGSAGPDFSKLQARPSFDEEFDTLRLWNGSSGIWRTTYGFNKIFNFKLGQEEQLYVSPSFTGDGIRPLGLNPFHLQNGLLQIVAEPAPAQVQDHMWGYRYTSGLLTTAPSFSQRYGYFEMRAKLPAGQGLWPAFWMLPSEGKSPPELDIMEVIGQDPTKLHLTLHSADPSVGADSEGGKQKEGYSKKRNGNRQRFSVDTPDMSADFHLYSVFWDPDQIIWYFDRREVARAPTPVDMRQPMFMLINLAVGGRWPGSPDQSTRFPAAMTIDYVKAFALK